MDYLGTISSLLGMADKVGVPQAALGKIAVDLIIHIKDQTGKSTEQIISEAGLTLEENDKMLLADLERLSAASPQPAPTIPSPAAPPGTQGQGTATTPPEPPPTIAEAQAKLAKLHAKLDAATSEQDRSDLRQRIANWEIKLAQARNREGG